ncbi:MAG: D-tyrosyl-tRNA(Tyr) deacylase [Candidatus Cloacimonetes bacterium HGW-Cloacimonetes-3]|jgi:D-tyrosyl-tRNA(Tyr) deacylase|nr:MAG: D-tyrosyl-tRNA(Tyr) deacylase [Candidatus Cloacimonetes bacterium HGW-Cloacimonetes-3]
MRITLQRVSSACCRVNEQISGEIGNGLLLFVGFAATDDVPILSAAAAKCTELRIFADTNGKLNHSLLDTGGSILLISQFTLYANCNRGRRPDFTQAAAPEHAKLLYNDFILLLRQKGINVQTGIFAADMQVSLVNDGPITINLEW